VQDFEVRYGAEQSCAERLGAFDPPVGWRSNRARRHPPSPQASHERAKRPSTVRLLDSCFYGDAVPRSVRGARHVQGTPPQAATARRHRSGKGVARRGGGWFS